MRLNIGIDIDGVLADFGKAFHRICQFKFGIPVEAVSKNWDFNDIGLTKAQVGEAWDCIKRTHNFWTHLLPLPGVNFATLLPLTNHRLYFITARVQSAGDTLERQTAHWLWRQLSIVYPTVIVAEKKGELAAALELDYFVDDRPKNLLDILNHTGGGCRVFLVNQPHNEGFKGLDRVKDVNEFVNIVANHKEDLIAA